MAEETMAEEAMAEHAAGALVMRRRIHAPAETVFGFFVEPEKMLRWLGISGEIVAEVGGSIRIDVTGGDLMVGQYVEITPPHQVSFTWGWLDNDEVPPGSTTVTFELHEDGDATELTMTHAGLPLGLDDQHATGWTYFFGRLRSAAAGDDPGPVSLENLGSITPVLEDLT